MSLVNIETVCARYGQKIALAEGQNFENNLKITDRENVITKALGVLTENGIYAMTIFLMSCNFAKFGTHIAEILLDLLSSEKVNLCAKAKGKDIFPQIQDLTEDLPRLILAKRISEQTLTFARYHCKAQNKREKQS